MKKIGYFVHILQKNGNVAKYFYANKVNFLFSFKQGKMILIHNIFWGKETKLCNRIQIL